MPDGTEARSYGTVFNQVAGEYDRRRPAYPDQLIDRACQLAGIGRGDRVLEIGCGTGQLTRSLLARGLRITAVEPGDQLIALAQRNLEGAGDVRFVNARLEDAALPADRFRAVFCASAIHWIDPDVSWRRAADALVPGGTLALLHYFGLRDERSADDQQALLSVVAGVAPEIAAAWPEYRDLAAITSGAQARRGNVSEVWAWLGGYDLARDYAAHLFDDMEFSVVPMLIEQTAEEANRLLATMSFWARISPEQRSAVTDGNTALYERLGRPLRANIAACLMTARHVASAQWSLT